jgi:uncharacterized protein (TIGR03435 family)
MKTSCLTALILTTVFAIVVAFGQTKPAFEAASIRPAPTQVSSVNVGLHMDGSQARFTYLSLKDYISRAYRLKAYQIVGPDWLAGERFDIAAKLPDGATAAQIPEMLQALLDERFHLKIHRDMKDFPVYSLEIAKGGIKMKELPSDSDTATSPAGALNVTVVGTNTGVGYSFGNGSTLTFSARGLEGKKITMRALAETLSWYVDRPVVDMTGLKGNYDIMLDISEEDFRAMTIRSAVVAGVVLPPPAMAVLDRPWGDSLTNSLGKAGLTLEQRKSPLEVIVIDSIEKKPTDN